MSKIYLVERSDGMEGYDEAIAFVVVAKSPKEARHLCSAEAGDEGAAIWQKAFTTDLGFPHDKTSRIILRDFNGS